MNLLALTASQNVGHIDWEPYIPMIFTRILRSLDLPVCYKSMKSARNQTLWSSSVASNARLFHYYYHYLKRFDLIFSQLYFSLDCIGARSE